MRNILVKEMKLSASLITYLFIVFGLMFFIPGYPILCGAFFSALGIFKGFDYAREANDIVFSALLPIAKKDVVKGRFCFVCMIELCTLAVMAAVTLVRMTALSDLELYRGNALMNANFFALGAAFFLFGLFNLIFVGGFFRTAYKTGRPFIVFLIVCFIFITLFEALHHIPGLGWLNAFGTDGIGVQILLLLIGVASFALMTLISCRKACDNFERIDL